MTEKVYVVEWRRAYSEYDFCYISMSKAKAAAVKNELEHDYPYTVYRIDFAVNEYDLDEKYEIWS